MEYIPRNRFLEFKPNTLTFLREQYNLNTPERINEAIDILEQWIQKQNHFMRKDFSRDYLERLLISSKGSVEKAKTKLDKNCTFRTLMPDMFSTINAKELVKEYNNDIIDVILPKLTDDYCRVYILRNVGQKFNGFSNYYKFLIMLCQYIQAYDYCNGLIAIFDYRETNILEVIKNLDLVEIRQLMTLITEGFSFRIKGIHFITKSRAIDTMVSIVKQGLSEKLAKRIQIHKDHSSLADHMPLDILPIEYGGKEKSINKIHDDLMEELSTKEFLDYLKEMKKAQSDESQRQTDKFNDQYMGMPGSFRTLSVD